MTSSYETARQQGYTDEQIQEHFKKRDPQFASKYQKAIESGYNPEEIFQHVNEPPKESVSKNIGRQVGRTGARIAETVLGAPRAAGEFLESLVPEKALKAGAEKIGLKEPVEKGLEIVKKYAPHKLFPSSQDIRENITKNLFGQKLEPKNEAEKFSDEVFSDFAALAIPLPGKQFQLLKPALLSLGGNVAGDIAGRVTDSDKAKTYTKLGTMFLGSLINPKGAQQFTSDLYKKAREQRPANATVINKSFIPEINKLETELNRGGAETWKTKISTKINELRARGADNEIEVEELERFKTSINNIIGELYAERNVGKSGIKSARRYANKLSKVIDDSLTKYGEENPEWEKYYRPANEAFGAIAQSHKVRNMLMKFSKSSGLKGALGLFGIEQAAGLGTTSAGAAVGAATLLTAELMARIAKSPTLRRYYGNVLKNALKDDSAAVGNNLIKLQKELDKDES